MFVLLGFIYWISSLAMDKLPAEFCSGSLLKGFYTFLKGAYAIIFIYFADARSENIVVTLHANNVPDFHRENAGTLS